MAMFDAKPCIHNLRDAIYVRWLGYEWIIPKV